MNTRAVAMVILVVAQFMDLMDAMITNVALPTIRQDIGASQSQLEWTLTAYILVFAVVLITGGRLGDIYGRQRVFLIGIAGFTVASLGAALAQSGIELVLARGMQGGFAALMVPQVLSTAQALYRPHERGKIFGLMSALGGVGVLTGQVLGGWLVSLDLLGLSWRTVFLINIPVGIAIFVLALFLVPNSKTEHPLRLDLVGIVLASTTVFLLAYPLIEGNSLHWPAWIWLMPTGSVVVLALFVRSQNRAQSRDSAPLLPLTLFRRRGFATGNLVQLCYQMGWGSFALMIGLYVQEALGFSPLQAGLVMVPVTLGSFIGTALAPVAARIGRPMVVLGAVVQAAGFAWFAIVLWDVGADLSPWSLALPLAVTGIGMIMLAVPLMGLALAEVPPGEAGAASGTFAMFQQLGYAMGIAIVGIIFFRIIGSDASFEHYRDAIITGNWVTIGAFTLAAVAALSLPGRIAGSLVDGVKRPVELVGSRTRSQDH